MDLIRQIEDDYDDERNPQISPAILNTNWTSESIQQWCKDRTKKYPTMAKAEKVELIRQFREERFARMRTEMKDFSESANKRKKRDDKFQYKKKPRVFRKYGEYEFPDCDYEDDEDGVKDGIFMFKGTKAHDKDCLRNENVEANFDALPISDSDHEEGSSCLDSTLSDKDEPQDVPTIASAKVMEYSYQANEDNDDDAPPQAVTIKKSSMEDLPELIKPASTNRDKPQTSSSSTQEDKPEKPRIEAIKNDKFNNDYLRILRKKKGQETFLEKLLENEIVRERHELLQCLHYVVTNNFFRE